MRQAARGAHASYSNGQRHGAHFTRGLYDRLTRALEWPMAIPVTAVVLFPYCGFRFAIACFEFGVMSFEAFRAGSISRLTTQNWTALEFRKCRKFLTRAISSNPTLSAILLRSRQAFSASFGGMAPETPRCATIHLDEHYYARWRWHERLRPLARRGIPFPDRIDN